jgi:hypothetical protein
LFGNLQTGAEQDSRQPRQSKGHLPPPSETAPDQSAGCYAENESP